VLTGRWRGGRGGLREHAPAPPAYRPPAPAPDAPLPSGGTPGPPLVLCALRVPRGVVRRGGAVGSGASCSTARQCAVLAGLSGQAACVCSIAGQSYAIRTSNSRLSITQPHPVLAYAFLRGSAHHAATAPPDPVAGHAPSAFGLGLVQQDGVVGLIRAEPGPHPAGCRPRRQDELLISHFAQRACTWGRRKKTYKIGLSSFI
jgi:hypothetical protein